MNGTLIESPSLLVYLEKIKEWMTARGKTIDIGRVVQISMLILAIATIVFEAGRIIDRQDSNKEAILSVIKSNEEKRDVRDSNKDKDLSDLHEAMHDEARRREKVEEKADRLERLLLVQFGHAAEGDPLKREK